MNDQSLTRRDVVALFCYVFIGFTTLSWVLGILTLGVLPHFPSFASSRSGQLPDVYTVIIAFTPLFWLPFVSLVATSITGRVTHEVATSKTIRSLILPCIGMGLFFSSFPNLLRAFYYLYMFSLNPPTSTTIAPIMRANFLVGVADSLIRLSLGFALAFFPAIFSSLRHRIRGEPNENAA